MAHRDEFGAFLVGFIVGGLTGAVVSLLFAPQSGEETRAVIKERAIELRDKAASGAESTWQRAGEIAGDVRARGEEITLKAKEKGKELVETAKDTAKRVTSRGKSDAEAA